MGARRSGMVGLIIITLATVIFTESGAIKSVATPALRLQDSPRPFYVISKPLADNFSGPTEARNLMYETQTKLIEIYALDQKRVKVKADREADYHDLCRGLTPCDTVEVLKLPGNRDYTVRIVCPTGEHNTPVVQPIPPLVAQYLAKAISNHDKTYHK